MMRYLPTILTSTIVVLLIVFYFFSSIFITIKAGEAGVLFRRFAGGTVTDRVYREGMHVIFPWNTMAIYNTRIQQKSYSVKVLTSEGLKIKLNVSVRYHPERDAVGILHQRVGQDYLEKVIIPEVDHTLRVVVGKMTVDDVYTSAGMTIHKILTKSISEIEQNYIFIQDVLIRQVFLPAQIEEAIEAKIEQKQLYEAYEYRLSRAQQEAKRKKIEAEGVYQYNTRVNESLTDKMLKWKGIMATQALAESDNAKVVVIGNGGDQLPIILGGATGQ